MVQLHVSSHQTETGTRTRVSDHKFQSSLWIQPTEPVLVLVPTFNGRGLELAADVLHVSMTVLDLSDSLRAPQLHQVLQLLHADSKVAIMAAVMAALSHRVPRRVVGCVVGHVDAAGAPPLSGLADGFWVRSVLAGRGSGQIGLLPSGGGCWRRTLSLDPGVGEHAPSDHHGNQEVNMLPLCRETGTGLETQTAAEIRTHYRPRTIQSDPPEHP